MDINYLLGREQTSLHNASVASSSPARIAHEGLAKAYGELLAASTFPHRRPTRVTLGTSIRDEETWRYGRARGVTSRPLAAIDITTA